MSKLLIVIGSTRPGRAGKPIADWFERRAREHGGFDVEVADLHALDLPLFDEPAHPRLGDYEHDHTKAWSATVDAADAIVVVTPEYNHGYPAALKNAIDFLHNEWKHKPVGYVSYGGVAAGTRAVQQLKPVFAALSVMSLPEAVNIPFHTQFLDDDGEVVANDVMEQSATALLDALGRWDRALRPLREEARAAA